MSKAHEEHSLNKSQTDMKRKHPLAIENHSAFTSKLVKSGSFVNVTYTGEYNADDQILAELSYM
jgi:hypothetical protein